MERPECSSCPYWDELDDHEYAPIIGLCHRTPPRYTGSHTSSDSSKSATPDAWDFPWTTESDWCGEHPDFPAYIAALKSHSSPRNVQ